MRKETLRKIRRLDATPAIISRASIPVTEKMYGGTKYKRNYAMFLRCQTAGPYLKIAVFLPDDLKKDQYAKFEIFINPEGEEYITRVMVHGKEAWWSTARIDKLPYPETQWSYFYYSKNRDWINPEGKNTIKRMLGVSEGGYAGIKEWQERIQEKRIKEKEKKEQAPWDADMALVPELPKGFDNWCKKKVIDENFIFYEYSRNVKEGYCSYCEKMVPAAGARHGKKGVCQVCKKKITYKSTGKIRRLATETYQCQLIQSIPGGFVLRGFDCQRSYAYDRDYYDPYYYIHEYRRAIFLDGSVRRYIWDVYKNKYYRWIPHIYSYYSHCSGLIYPKTLPSLRKKITHTGLFEIIKRYPTISIDGYINEEKDNPILEKIVKAGCYNLAKESMYQHLYINENETELAKMLCIDKAKLSRLRAANGGIIYLSWLQKEKQQNTIYTEEMIKGFSIKDISPERLDFISKKLTYAQIFNYLCRQQIMGKDTFLQMLYTWRDYLDMAVKLHMNLDKEMIYKPKNLQQAHDELILALESEKIKEQEEEIRKQWPKVEGVLKELGKYEYESGKYCIQAPKSIGDIIKEGTVLRHCVHTCDFYFDRIGRRETYLLFLRRNQSKETPWYTLEVEPSGNIRQKRTTGDQLNEDIKEAIPFLKKWQKEIQKRLSKEDKELGRESDKLRKQEYAKLKKDGNRIWHGVLQGQLLADVLEADFMAFDNAG